MNKLWIRLSLMITAVIFIVFFFQFLGIFLEDHRATPPTAGETAHIEGPGGESREELTRRLLEFAVLSLIIGALGGLVIGNIVSRPITHLARAAHRIGDGDLTVRVPIHGGYEMEDLARAFNKMADGLEQAETLRTNLMADVSHELRTPLTALEGNLRAALDDVYALNETDIANLYSQTRHLIRLVNDLRELALAEAHRLPLELGPVDLNALTLETLQALEPLAAEKGIRLCDRTAPLPLIQGDADRLQQVLFNLLFNALHHTPTDGEIAVQSLVTPTEISLTVNDTGVGLTREELKSVFDRFYRGDKSRSRKTGSTGLGLAIVKGIIEAHGGRVVAASPGPGQGSAFTFTLPKSPTLL